METATPGQCTLTISCEFDFSTELDMKRRLVQIGAGYDKAGFRLDRNSTMLCKINGQVITMPLGDLEAREALFAALMPPDVGEANPTTPFGGNLFAVIDAAQQEAFESKRDIYVFQHGDGTWSATPYAPCDLPFLLVNQNGLIRAGCEYCETDTAARQRALAGMRCPTCHSLAMTTHVSLQAHCLTCGEVTAFPGQERSEGAVKVTTGYVIV